jgi:hypothetical protein
VWKRPCQRRLEQRQRRDPLLVPHGELHRDARTEAVADQAGLVDAALGEHRPHVLHVRIERVRRRPRGAAVAPKIVREHEPVSLEHAPQTLEPARMAADVMHAHDRRPILGAPGENAERRHGGPF